MKITTLILFLAIMQVSATTLAQKVSIKANNVPLSAIFDQISSQTGYDFAYTTKTLENAKLVTINVKNEELNDVLKQIFEDQPLSYTIQDKFVTVSIRQPTTLDKLKSVFTSLTIHGNVTDEKGLPIPGATVKIKKTGQGTITNERGEFTLKNVDDHDVLVISFIGYLTKEVNANGDLSNIKLEVSSSKLDEVNVVAYGETSQRLTVGNISKVSAKEIEQQPVSNPLVALEGRVPGLFITQSSGLPGSGVTVRIQGQNSMSNGNDPLYVIDGVPYASQVLPSITGILGGSGPGPSSAGAAGGGNPLSFINPADIESIEVLKDADATSIYGSRAANGAILITTKKGKGGDTKVDVNVQNGWGNVTRTLQVLNTTQYLAVRNEAFKNDNAVPQSYDYDVNGLWDKTRNTDWQKVLIGNTAQYTDGQASISGGTANTQFLVGGGYHRETTVFPGPLADQKASLHFNLNNVSQNQRFHFQFSGSYMVDNNQLQIIDLTNTAIQLAPDAPALYNKDGSLNWMPDANGNSTWINPLAWQYAQYNVKTNNLISNAVLSYTILDGLDIKSNFGYTDQRQNEFFGAPLLIDPPEQRSTSAASAQYGNNSVNSWIIEPQVTFKRVIAKGKLDVLLGSTFEQNNSNREQLNGTGYNSDAVLEDIHAASTVTVGSTFASVYKYNALFGRINYNWADKYLIDLNARRDGSSRFGSNNLFHDFYSVGGGWIFSNEDFIKNNLPFLSYGKLRASYGTTGNDQIGDYNFLSLYNPISVANPYRGVSALSPNGLPNPDLQWELTKKMQFGLELGFFSDRILLTANYFNNRSSNQLLSYSLPIITGFFDINAVNFPATVQNSGWELSINTTNIKTKDLKWSSSFNLTIPENKLIAFPGIATSAYANTYAIGQPISSIKVLHFLGVDPATGLYTVADSHGNPTTTPDYTIDKTVFINTAPKIYGGIENRLTYKGFELDFLFQFVKQTGPNYFFGNGPGETGNQPITVLNHWQKPGDISPNQIFVSGNGSFTPVLTFLNATQSDAAYSDASFIRLKNLSLSCQLPNAWGKAAHFQYCRLILRGQNLMTITKYAGMDPENMSVYSLPPLRVITAGLQIGL